MTLLVENTTLRAAFRRGDKQALSTVYRAYARDVVMFLRRGFSFDSGGKRLGFGGYQEPWRVENLTQEIFIRAFSESARQGYDGLRPYKNYLLTIGKNLVIDQLRRTRRDLVPLDDIDEASAVDPLGDPEKNPEETASDEQLRREVAAFLEGLSREDRAIFDERFSNGLSIEEVAGRLDVTEYTVKKTEKLLKKRFFQHLQASGFFAGYRFNGIGVEKLVTQMLCLWAGRL